MYHDKTSSESTTALNIFTMSPAKSCRVVRQLVTDISDESYLFHDNVTNKKAAGPFEMMKAIYITEQVYL